MQELQRHTSVLKRVCVQVIQFLRMFLFYVSESIKFYFCLLNVIIKYKAWRFLPIEPTPYVNDTSFFLKNNKNSFRQLTETFSTSSQYSCLGTDYEKNEFAGVGVLKIRSSRPKVFCKKGVLRNFANSEENTCARVSLLIKLQASGLQLC